MVPQGPSEVNILARISALTPGAVDRPALMPDTRTVVGADWLVGGHAVEHFLCGFIICFALIDGAENLRSYHIEPTPYPA